MKKGVKVITVTIIASILLIIYYIFFVNKNAIKEAVSYFKAWQLVKEEDFYIIYQKKGLFEEGIETYYYDGNVRGPVILTGKNPFNMHGNNGNSAIFCGAAKNKFLVKGKVITEYKNVVEETVINVEEWEIIAPIKRVYRDEYTRRYIYPVSCIDEYDVERGDYISDTVGNQILYSWEVDYYLENKEDYYLVSFQREGDNIISYLCLNGIPDEKEFLTQRIVLMGNFPEKERYGKILDEEICDERHYRNFILVKGKYEDNTIQVEEWKLADIIHRKQNEKERWHSVYFLDESDLK